MHPIYTELPSWIYTGFLAQQVKAVAEGVEFDFSGPHDPHNPGKEPYSLRYASFAVPLVKAVQEQQELIEKLLDEIEKLKSSIKSLESEY